VPSSFCGVWGLKPTYGQLSRAGAFLFAGSLDTIGVFGREVSDLAASFDAMLGFDARDPVCREGQADATLPTLDDGIDDLGIALLGGYFRNGWSDGIAAAMQSVTESLRVTNEIELPKPEIARSAAYAITATEGGEFPRHRLRTRAADYDPADRDRFIAGSLAPAEWYLQAQRFRAWWQARMDEVFRSADVLLAPATPLAAPLLDQSSFELDGTEYALRANIGLWTQPITLIGLPVLAAPVHLPGQLPLAVQIIGKPGSERKLLRVAKTLEASGVCTAPVPHIG
jgi:Asp-tRNA(Asn)/Glu-tRNA(Gln) amidotransferase A subunit family amidase